MAKAPGRRNRDDIGRLASSIRRHEEIQADEKELAEAVYVAIFLGAQQAPPRPRLLPPASTVSVSWRSRCLMRSRAAWGISISHRNVSASFAKTNTYTEIRPLETPVSPARNLSSAQLDKPTTRTPKPAAAPMPSKRPPPTDMDTGAAAASPPSKKRSSRAKPRMDDDRPEPNPSPNPSRKSERKRRPRALPDSAAVTAPPERRPRALPKSAAVTAPRPRAPPESAALTALAAATPPCPGPGAVQRLWSDVDEVNLLTGAAAFRARTGFGPRLPDMGALFNSIRGSLSPHLDQAKVYYKLKRLKSKFLHAAPAAAASRHDLRVRDLCNNVWGAHLGLPAEDDAAFADEEEEASERRTVPDAAAMLPVVTEVLDAYWKTNGPALSGVSLEKGLSLLETEAARLIEAKWRQQLDGEVHTQMRRHDLAKEVYGLLLDAIKGLGP